MPAASLRDRDLGRYTAKHIETCGTAPCFAVRNGAEWAQFARLPEGSVGKFLVVLGRGSSERVWRDGNITGVPYLHVAFAKASLTRYIYVDVRTDTDRSDATRVNQWVTMSTIKPIPPEAAFLWLKLAHGLRRGTPHNGSAAWFKDVEARIFDTQDAARHYIDSYNALHESDK